MRRRPTEDAREIKGAGHEFQHGEERPHWRGRRQCDDVVRVYSKVSRRIMPLPVVCCFIAYLERTHGCDAQLQMKATLPFSGAVYWAKASSSPAASLPACTW